MHWLMRNIDEERELHGAVKDWFLIEDEDFELIYDAGWRVVINVDDSWQIWSAYRCDDDSIFFDVELTSNKLDEFKDDDDDDDWSF